MFKSMVLPDRCGPVALKLPCVWEFKALVAGNRAVFETEVAKEETEVFVSFLVIPDGFRGAVPRELKYFGSYTGGDECLHLFGPSSALAQPKLLSVPDKLRGKGRVSLSLGQENMSCVVEFKHKPSDPEVTSKYGLTFMSRWLYTTTSDLNCLNALSQLPDVSNIWVP